MRIKNLIIQFGTICLLMAVFVSCNTDSYFFDSQEMYDYEHLSDDTIHHIKGDVFQKLVNFHDWYKNVWHNMTFEKEKWSMWGTAIGDSVDFDSRVKYIKEEMLQSIGSSEILTDNLKSKAVNNFEKLEDPGNLAILLTGNKNGNVLTDIVQIKTADDRYNFHSYYLHSNSYLEDIPPQISYEEAEYYHLSMIKILDNKTAVYKVNYQMVSSGLYSLAEFLLVFLVKDEGGNWKVDDIIILDDSNMKKNQELREFVPWEEPVDVNDPDFLP